MPLYRSNPRNRYRLPNPMGVVVVDLGLPPMPEPPIIIGTIIGDAIVAFNHNGEVTHVNTHVAADVTDTGELINLRVSK